MENYQKYKSKLKKFGYSESENISDFWFANKDRIWKNIFFNNGEIDSFGLIIRWESEIGQVCQNEVRNYIEKRQKQIIDESSENFRKGIFSIHDAIIDFIDFTFQYKGQTYNIDTFSKSFKTSQLGGLVNLCGINLDNIKIGCFNFVNCCFAHASFKNSSLQQIKLINTSLIDADFEYSRFVMLSFDKRSTVIDANFKNSFINAITFEDHIIGDKQLKIKRIGYSQLLKWSIINLKHPIKLIDKNLNQTIFISNETKDISRSELTETKNYINWFQHIYKKVYRTENIPFRKRLLFFIEVLTTKYWTSFSALAIFSLFVNLFFSILIFTFKNNFHFTYSFSFFDCIYYSIVTFTTLGYGEITPTTTIGQFLMIIEVLTGYIVLGLFIFLISKKIDSKY